MLQDEYRALVEAREGFNKMFNELRNEREVSQVVTGGDRFSISDGQEKYSTKNFDDNGKNLILQMITQVSLK